jgi:hypothetical protein
MRYNAIQHPNRPHGKRAGVYVGHLEGDWLEPDNRESGHYHIYLTTDHQDYIVHM